MSLILHGLFLILGVGLGLALAFAGERPLGWCRERYWRNRPMFFRGLRLPPSFVRAAWRRHGSLWSLRQDPFDPWGGSSWTLKEPFDAYGRPWPRGGLSMHYGHKVLTNGRQPSDDETMPTQSRRYARGLAAWALDPAFISYPDDFSRILHFGGGWWEDEGLYFDYRDDLEEPSVISWDGVFWRRRASSFEALLSLLQPCRKGDSLPEPCHKAVRAQGVAAIVALLEAAQYDVWDTEVLLHVIFDENQQPIVVLLPVNEQRPDQESSGPDWLLSVRFPSGAAIDPAHPHEASAVVAASGNVSQLEPGSAKAMLGRAVAAVIEHESKRHDTFAPPLLFHPRTVQATRWDWAYCVATWRSIYRNPGPGHHFLSEDLRVVDFMGAM